MSVPAPHYLLFSEVGGDSDSGCWQFTLRRADGPGEYGAADVEPGTRGERLELLTIVRALESLDQPSRVSLVGCGRHVREGVEYGLSEWRNNGWRWEFFGHLVPLRNGDLWQRLDRALQFHRVDCRQHRIDFAHRPPRPREATGAEDNGQEPAVSCNRHSGRRALEYRLAQLVADCWQGLTRAARRWRRAARTVCAPEPGR